MAEADEDIQKARAHELILVTAHRNNDSTPTLIPTESTGRPKIPYAAFRPFLENETGIDEYLADIERQCALHQIPNKEWPTILSGKLSG
ncbi:Hypothetical predicted protein [Pelobates cultripes]|uniref:Uncharacterized protein n=1 Tax=Pelobates cultripes TaxID=61616 RepID=A0AAD1R958_PELCU|nr:Hypothetical predicted protein [Pelobates cultripes]